MAEARYQIRATEFIRADKLTDEVHAAVENGMRGAIAIVVADAKRSVARGPKTGRIYTRRGITHQASAPGEPPATDTGVLVNSIAGDIETSERQNGFVRAYIRASAAYAGFPELGTRRMAARPFLVPAIERNRAAIQKFMADTVRMGIGRFMAR